MFKKILTNLIIFMLAVLPVQVFAASIENDSMKLSDRQVIQVKHECMHGVTEDANKNSDMPCCEDSFAFHQCDGCDSCGDCVQATTVMMGSVTKFIIPLNFKTQKIVSNHLFLNGVSSESPIRPPRTLI